MSAQEAVAESAQPIEQNAAAAEDAKKMLAELQAEQESKPDLSMKPESNGATTASDANGEAKSEIVNEKAAGQSKETEKHFGENDRRREQREGGGRGARGDGRGGGRGGKFKNFRENIKSDLMTKEESNDPVAIRKQVEFYFSDSNLPMDKFLLEKVGGSKNNPVELSILHSFKRMRHFQPFEAIVEAMKESTVLQLTDDNTCVQRREPLPEALNNGPDPNAVRVFEDRAMPRSIYAKGFGEELPSTQFDIEAFFNPYGPTNAIRLRRTDSKTFKGSVFVEFESEELATKFLELDPKPQYKGKDLQIMTKKEYCDKKVDDIKSGKIQAGKNRQFNNRPIRGGRGGGRGDRRKRDNEDDRDWRQRRDEDRKNGFKDDKRRNNRDQDKKADKPELDERGIPVVGTSTAEDDKPKRDSAKEEALNKARAAVTADKKRGREEDDMESGAPPGKKLDIEAEA